MIEYYLDVFCLCFKGLKFLHEKKPKKIKNCPDSLSIYTTMMLRPVLTVVNSGYGRKKYNVDKYNLDEPDYGLQIKKNWIWKKNYEVEENADETVLILTEHQGLKIRLKDNKAF